MVGNQQNEGTIDLSNSNPWTTVSLDRQLIVQSECWIVVPFKSVEQTWLLTHLYNWEDVDEV